jgi:uncharacterized protein (UPF0262 family)
MPEQRPVTACIEQELTTELRRRGIVFWLDKDAHYTAYVDELAGRHTTGDFPYPVVPFRGSFLETMLTLEGHENDLDPTPLLIHMPGFTEDMMRGTPLLELYKAGYRHRRALDTAIREAATGQVPPNEIDEFLTAKDYTLAKADAWLARRVVTGRTDLSELLDTLGIEFVVQDFLIKNTALGGRFDKNRLEDLEVLRAFLERQFGMTRAWMEFVQGGDAQARPYNVLMDALASWVLCVEYADDLRREPHLEALRPLRALHKSLIAVCRAQAQSLREHYPKEYEAIADRVQDYLVNELPQVRPEDLGRVDTFRSEEARILEAAVTALQQGQWQKARDWAEERTSVLSFWLSRDRERMRAWTLVADGALLGCLIDEHQQPFAGIASFASALTEYKDHAYKVDQAQRRFEARRLNLLGPQLPHFAQLKAAVGELRRRYREWADKLAADFTALCRTKGMLPEPELQQRQVYEQVVLPLTKGTERTAVFLVDALRYEMATELVEELATKGTAVTLNARYAELPTITAVGMNALAPLAREGRLTLAGSSGFEGFSAGEFAVRTPENRAKAMGQRSSGALALTLTEVCELDADTLKRKVAQKKLIVVHDRELDDAGEAGVGLATFEQTLGRLKAAWHHLNAAGVKQLVITADHGFLLTDETTKGRPFGKKTDPHPRYVLAQERRAEAGLVTVSLAELGYEGREGYLLFPEDTTVFDTGPRTEGFVHGGNSPTERIIPVLTVTSKFRPNVDLSMYRVLAEREATVLGCHRIRVRLVLDREQSSALPFARSAPVGLALQVSGRGDEVRALVKDVTAPGTLKGGRLQLPVDAEWVEVFFNLEGPEDERARVEVFHPDGIEQITACVVEGWFDVEGKERRPTIEPPAPQEWIDSLPDDGTRRVFAHLYEHGSITEDEATGMLGGGRQFRRFSNKFEDYLRLTPLKVQIENVAGVKRYVRKATTDGTR